MTDAINVMGSWVIGVIKWIAKVTLTIFAVICIIFTLLFSLAFMASNSDEVVEESEFQVSDYEAMEL